MKPEDTKAAAYLVEAFDELPAIGRALTDKPVRHYDAIHLELSAAEMADGLGQGSSHYCTLPPAIGRKIIAAAQEIIRAELTRLGVRLPAKRKGKP